MRTLLFAALIGLAGPSWGLGSAISQTPEPVTGGTISSATVTTLNSSTVTVSGTGSKCLSVDDPTLTVDCNLNRVGVGVAAPSATVDVQGTANLDTVQLSGINSTGASYGLRVAAGTNSSDRTATFLSASGGSTHLYIRGDGNVGLGTASPATKLHMSSGTLMVDGNNTLSLDVNGNVEVGGSGANNKITLDSASGLTQIIMQRGAASKWSINNNVDGTDFFNIQSEAGGFSAAAITPAGLFRPRIRTAAQIHAITPDILGGVVVCSDCTRPYTICVATGTASADQFREQGETTGCY